MQSGFSLARAERNARKEARRVRERERARAEEEEKHCTELLPFARSRFIRICNSTEYDKDKDKGALVHSRTCVFFHSPISFRYFDLFYTRAVGIVYLYPFVLSHTSERKKVQRACRETECILLNEEGASHSHTRELATC